MVTVFAVQLEPGFPWSSFSGFLDSLQGRKSDQSIGTAKGIAAGTMIMTLIYQESMTCFSNTISDHLKGNTITSSTLKVRCQISVRLSPRNQSKAWDSVLSTLQLHSMLVPDTALCGTATALHRVQQKVISPPRIFLRDNPFESKS